MSKSYYPTDRAGRIDWHSNFAKEFRKVGNDLGFTDAEITNGVNDSKYAVHILQTLGPEIDSDPGHAANRRANMPIFLPEVVLRPRFAPGSIRAGRHGWSESNGTTLTPMRSANS